MCNGVWKRQSVGIAEFGNTKRLFKGQHEKKNKGITYAETS